MNGRTSGSCRTRTGTARLFVLVAALLAASGVGNPYAADPPPAAPSEGATSLPSPTSLDAVLDSLRAETRATNRWDQFVSTTDWDSTAGDWIPDAEVDLRGRRSALKRFHLGVVPRWRVDKVEGLTPGAGLRVEWGRRPGTRLSGGMDRATAAGRWGGEVTASFQSDARVGTGPPPATRARLGGSGSGTSGRASWYLSLTYAEQAVPFGGNRPAYNGVQTTLLSRDGRSYLQREERTAAIGLRAAESVYFDLAYTERRDGPLVSHMEPLWNTDPKEWENVAAERLDSRGILLGTRANLGVRFTARAGAFGGALGGDAEYYPIGAEARHAFHVPGSERLDVEVWVTGVLGDAPRQEWADLGGVSSLRAHAPGELVGRASGLLRLDYILRFDVLRRLHVPFARQLRLQPTAFVDLGAVWGDEDWTRRQDVRGPSSSDVRTDIGVGLQRNMGYPGLLGTVRVNFGWRTDRSTDRFRATVQISP